MPIDDQRRSRIKKGMFLTSSPVPPGYVAKRQPLPDDLAEFEAAAAMADDMAAIDRRHAAAMADDMAAIDRRHAAEVGELVRRLQAVRRQLDDIKKRDK
jgi:hypothetical protein